MDKFSQSGRLPAVLILVFIVIAQFTTQGLQLHSHNLGDSSPHVHDTSHNHAAAIHLAFVSSHADHHDLYQQSVEDWQGASALQSAKRISPAIVLFLLIVAMSVCSHLLVSLVPRAVICLPLRRYFYTPFLRAPPL